MSLIKCDECGHKISDKSVCCPRCGYPTHLNKALQTTSAASEEEHRSSKDREEVVVPPSPVFSETAPITSGPGDPDPEEEAREMRKNHRAKVTLFLGVFAVAAIAIGILWYIGASAGSSATDVDVNKAFEVTVEEPTATPSDSLDTNSADTLDNAAAAEAATAPAVVKREKPKDPEVEVDAVETPQPEYTPSEPIPTPTPVETPAPDNSSGE